MKTKIILLSAFLFCSIILQAQEERTRTSLTLRGTHSNLTMPGDVVTIYGQLSPEYATPPGPIPINIWVTMPDGSMYVSEPPTSGDPNRNYIFTDDHSHYEFNIPITQYGYTRVRVWFGGNLLYESSESEIIIHVPNPTGATIVVAGNGFSSDLFDTIEILADMAVATMRRRNVPDDPNSNSHNRIYYLHPDPTRTAVDAESTPENLEWAIKNWAADHFQTHDAQGNWWTEGVLQNPLTIFLIGSINEDPIPQNSEFVFDVSQGDRVVSAVLLGEWLDELESTIKQQFVDAGISPPNYVPINVIVEGPTSGDFIYPLSKQGRVILTSTNSVDRVTREGGKSYLSADGSVAFISMFLSRIAAGQYIQPSFAHARYEIASNQALNLQKPQLEASGNGIANETVDELATATMPLEYRPYGDAKPRLQNGFGSITLRDIPVAQLWVYVDDAEDAVATVEAVLTPPEGSFEESHIVTFAPHPTEPNRWEGEYVGFYGEGIYTVMYTATDAAGNIAVPITKDIIVSDSQNPEDVTNLHFTCEYCNHICMKWNVSASPDVQGYRIYADPPDSPEWATTLFLLSDVGNVHQFFNQLDISEQPGIWRFIVTAYDRAGLESSGNILEFETQNTPDGGNIVVNPQDMSTGNTPVEITFSNVTYCGNTTLETGQLGSELPPSFVMGDPPTIFNIETTAQYSGTIQIVIDYSDIAFENEDVLRFNLRLLHYESDQWVDVTTILDRENSLIYGEVTNLSQFTVGELLPYVYVPDDNFEQTLIDLEYDFELDDYVLRSNISEITALDIANKNISDLTGLEAFVGLISLSCSHNQLTFLDVSNAVNLIYLYCGSNQLSSLDVSNNTKLNYLYCYYNQLSSLDVSENTALIKLRCYNNQLSSLDVSSNTELTELSCGSNQLSSLNVTSNTLLEKLNCEANHNISSLSVTENTSLVELWCGANVLSDLDVSNNPELVTLVSYSNNLTSLDVTQNTKLERLVCRWNDLISLDIRNGNNLNLVLAADENNLTCINVDDETADHSNWITDNGVIFSNDCSLNTQPGDQVLVPLLNLNYFATIHYESVTESGNTAMEITEDGPEIPDGFSFGVPINYFNIETSASYSGAIQNAIFFGSMTYTQEEAQRLLHYETDHWVDVTTEIDFNSSIIYGEVFSLSPFVVVEDIQPPDFTIINAPFDPVALGNSVNIAVAFTDNNVSSAKINWGDNGEWIDGVATENTVSWNFMYPEAGVYAVKIQLEDLGGHLVEETYRYIVIYDALEGFVTGGGWINSPAGASTQYLDAAGEANFGFVSKYKKGTTVPIGNTEFQFKAGDLNFNSYVYDWLVIAGSKAMFKGEGTINGTGPFGFMISAVDGDLKDEGGGDLFRIKIWDKNNNDEIVYDNQIGDSDDADPTTLLGGGSIVIHKSSVKKSTPILDEINGIEGTEVKIYPNPFDNSIYVDLISDNTHKIIIDMVDMNGRIIEIMYTGIVKADVDHHFELSTNLDLTPGFYMLRIRNEDGEYLSKEMILKH